MADEQKPGKLKIFPRMLMHGANTADTITTINRDKVNSHEANPLLGDNPSDIRVIGTKAVSSFLSDYLLSKIAKKHPKLANGIAIGSGIITSAVAANNYKHRNKE